MPSALSPSPEIPCFHGFSRISLAKGPTKGLKARVRWAFEAIKYPGESRPPVPTYTKAKINSKLVDRPDPKSGLSPRFYDVARTKVTSGRQLLPGIDNRCYWVRRVRDIIDRHTADLGGDDALSEAERSIIRRCGTLVAECERLERRFAQVPESGSVPLAELATYSMLANTLRRLLDMAGLEKRTHDITPTIDAYLASHADDPDGTDDPDDIIDVPTTPANGYVSDGAERRRAMASRRQYLANLKAERAAARAAKAAAKAAAKVTEPAE